MSACLETGSGYILAAIHESIRDFVRDASLVFTPEGVKLHGKDSANVVIVRYHLKACDIIANGRGR